MSNGQDYHVLQELKRLNHNIDGIAKKIDDTKAELNNHKIAILKDSAETKEELSREISRIDKELSFLKGKVAVISSGIGAVVASLPKVAELIRDYFS